MTLNGRRITNSTDTGMTINLLGHKQISFGGTSIQVSVENFIKELQQN
jgi:hypothetical protein